MIADVPTVSRFDKGRAKALMRIATDAKKSQNFETLRF